MNVLSMALAKDEIDSVMKNEAKESLLHTNVSLFKNTGFSTTSENPVCIIPFRQKEAHSLHQLPTTVSE